MKAILIRVLHGWLHTAAIAFSVLSFAFPTWATNVRLETSLGVIDIELFDTAAPATVTNFLSYVQSGAYDSTFVHRSSPGFVIQSGGYRWNTSNNTVVPVTVGAPVVNEFSPIRSNVRGTVAMAKLGGSPDSATSQWFVNLADNSANLDNQNGGFTVFGRIVGNGMTVVDAIAGITPQNINPPTGGPFDSTPFVPPVVNNSITAANLVMITRASIVPSTVDLVAGWNLVGNGTDAAINVATTFADTTQIVTVWKWLAAQSAWSFYAPALAAQGGTVLSDYATSKGYQVLSGVAGGEGFWVNAKQPANVSVSQGQSISVASVGSTMLKGWNLISVGEAATPKQFCDAQSGGVTTLWAWDEAGTKWYFYAPSLAAQGGTALTDYATSKGYVDFTASSKTLGGGIGFWVNKP